MYTKDKQHRITLRLNPDQFDFVMSSSEPLGVSPSEFLRMVINATMAMNKKATEKMDRVANAMKQELEQIKIEEEVNRRENEASIQHDQL